LGDFPGGIPRWRRRVLFFKKGEKKVFFLQKPSEEGVVFPKGGPPRSLKPFGGGVFFPQNGPFFWAPKGFQSVNKFYRGALPPGEVWFWDSPENGPGLPKSKWVGICLKWGLWLACLGMGMPQVRGWKPQSGHWESQKSLGLDVKAL